MVKVKTFPTKDITQNASKVFNIDDNDIAIINCNDEYYAIDDLCSHAEASLSDGEVYDCKVECPLHGAEFDLKTGEAITLPATHRVNTCGVSFDDGYLVLDIDNNA